MEMEGGKGGDDGRKRRKRREGDGEEKRREEGNGEEKKRVDFASPLAARIAAGANVCDKETGLDWKSYLTHGLTHGPGF